MSNSFKKIGFTLRLDNSKVKSNLMCKVLRMAQVDMVLNMLKLGTFTHQGERSITVKKLI